MRVGSWGTRLSHGFGAAYDNPDLIVAVVVGDGEAETGPLATSWHSNKFLNPVTDGAVLPILHLNGYKIANPTILARITPEELESLFVGYGWNAYFVEGDDPAVMHQKMAGVVEQCVLDIRAIQEKARRGGVDAVTERPRWPMIVLRSPKGWTDPKELDGHKLEGSWRSHQMPITDPKTNPAHLKLVEAWMRSYRPEELFDESGKLIPEIQGDGSGGVQPDLGQSACKWREAAEAAGSAGLPRLCGEGGEAGAGGGLADGCAGALSAAM